MLVRYIYIYLKFYLHVKRIIYILHCNTIELISRETFQKIYLVCICYIFFSLKSAMICDVNEIAKRNIFSS